MVEAPPNSGRGELSLFVLRIFPMPLVTFSPFFNFSEKHWSLARSANRPRLF